MSLRNAKGLLVRHQRDWRERSALNAMDMDTSKLIIPTKELCPLGRWRNPRY